MITLDTNYILPHGGQCDYCCDDLEPGIYSALIGYRLITNLTSEHRPDLEFDRVEMYAPFVPCGECLSFLDISEAPLTPGKVQALHSKVVDTFNEYYHSNVPYPTLELL